MTLFLFSLFLMNAVLKANATVTEKTPGSSTPMFDQQATEASPSGYVMSINKPNLHMIPSQIHLLMFLVFRTTATWKIFFLKELHCSFSCPNCMFGSECLLYFHQVLNVLHTKLITILQRNSELVSQAKMGNMLEII